MHTVFISLFSWSGSKYFSSLVASNSKRQALVKNIVQMVEKYNLDGVNLDWGTVLQNIQDNGN
jgi:chitinase